MRARPRAGGCREGRSPGTGPSAPLPRAALLAQGRLVRRGGSRSGRSGRRLLLLLPQSGSLLLLFCVALHVGAAALHLIKHPVAGQKGLKSEGRHHPPWHDWARERPRARLFVQCASVHPAWAPRPCLTGSGHTAHPHPPPRERMGSAPSSLFSEPPTDITALETLVANKKTR